MSLLTQYQAAAALTTTSLADLKTRLATITDVAPPSVPAGLSATAVGSSRVTLAWSAATDNIAVTGYTIYRGGSVLTTVFSPGYDDFAVAPSTTYSYTVDAYDAAGNHSAQSTSASATTAAAAVPPPPTGWRLARISIPFN